MKSISKFHVFCVSSYRIISRFTEAWNKLGFSDKSDTVGPCLCQLSSRYSLVEEIASLEIQVNNSAAKV
jgi:hypothetical protein